MPGKVFTWALDKAADLMFHLSNGETEHFTDLCGSCSYWHKGYLLEVGDMFTSRSALTTSSKLNQQ